VQSCINSADSGDTITFAAGEYAWAGAVTIPEAKTIILKGAGSNADTGTKITRAGAAIVNNSSNSSVSGFRFILTGSGGTIVEMRNIGWKVYDNYFDNQSGVSSECVMSSGTNLTMMPEGVIYRNTFNECRYQSNGMGTFAKMNDFWAVANEFGTEHAVYVEDNIITRTSGYAVDGNTGGKYVLRYNTITGVIPANHSVQSTATRASRSQEIYGNAISCNGYDTFDLRGGTGFLFYNRLTSTRESNGIKFDNVRSGAGLCGSGNCNVGDDPTYAGLCNGSSLWDGNQAVTASAWGGTGTIGAGTVTTANLAGILLTDSSQAWPTPNGFIKTDVAWTGAKTGTHTGADSSTTLTKASGTNWSTGYAMEGLYVRNTTDGSECFVTSFTATTQVCAGLTGGSDNTWHEGDGFAITEGITVYNTSACTTPGNLSTCAKGIIYANNGTTINHSVLTGGSRQTWEEGDTYKITDGYPCRDQIGRGADSDTFDLVDFAATTSEPTYLWANLKSTGALLPVYIGNYTTNWIQNNRDYFDYTESFNGTGGVGCGTLEDRNNITPTVAGVGFWVTTQGNCSSLIGYVGATADRTSAETKIEGTLYKWDGDSWEPYYTPYTYPHPLRLQAFTGNACIGCGGYYR